MIPVVRRRNAPAVATRRGKPATSGWSPVPAAATHAFAGNGDNGSGRWTVRIGILGPLEMRDEGGQPVRLGGARLRALLTGPGSCADGTRPGTPCG